MQRLVEKRAGVMGWPVHHSLSPKLHGYWIEQYGLSAGYDLLPVEPENLENALQSLLVNGYAGCNLTLPHKEKAVTLVDQLSPAAQTVQAVNTVVVGQDGKLFGDNTDIYGFLESLNNQSPGWEERTSQALIIGAGGAARAILYGLIKSGVKHITIANRSQDKAGALAHDFATPDTQLTIIPLSDLTTPGPAYDLVVNISVLGMTGKPELHINLSNLPKTATVSDIVYVPRLTPLLKQAQTQGLTIAEGIDMLLYQAVPSFEYWFGQQPVVTSALKDFITKDVNT